MGDLPPSGTKLVAEGYDKFISDLSNADKALAALSRSIEKAQGSFKIDASYADELKKLGGAAGGAQVPFSGSQVASEVAKADSAFRQLNAAVGGVTAAIKTSYTEIVSGLQLIQEGMRLVAQAKEFAQTGAQAERTAESFRLLAGSVGGSSQAILESLRQASAGTVSDTSLILSSNRAMMLGLGGDADKLGQLMEVARFRGRAMGLDTTQAFSDIVTGVGRMSPLILDNLGIIVDAETCYREWAQANGRTAESLSAMEKRQVLLNAVLAEGGQQIAEAGGVAADSADAYEQFDATLSNLVTTVQKLAASALLPLIENLSRAATTAQQLVIMTNAQAAADRAAQAEMEKRLETGEATMLFGQVYEANGKKLLDLDAIRQEAFDREMRRQLGLQAVVSKTPAMLDSLLASQQAQAKAAQEAVAAQQQQVSAAANAEAAMKAVDEATRTLGLSDFATAQATDALRIQQGQATADAVNAERAVEVLAAGYASGAMTADEYTAAIGRVGQGQAALADIARSRAAVEQAMMNEVAQSETAYLAKRNAQIEQWGSARQARIDKFYADEAKRTADHLAALAEMEADHNARLSEIAAGAQAGRLDAMSDFNDSMARIQKQLNSSLEDAGEQHQERLRQIEEQGEERRLALEESFAQERADVAAKYDKERLSLQEKVTANYTKIQEALAKTLQERQDYAEQQQILANLGLPETTDVSQLTDEQIQTLNEALEKMKAERIAKMAETNKPELDAIQARQDEELAILAEAQAEKLAKLEESLAKEEAAEDRAYAKRRADIEARAVEEAAEAEMRRNERLLAIDTELATKEAKENVSYLKAKTKREADFQEQSLERKTDLAAALADEDARNQATLTKMDAQQQEETKKVQEKYGSLLAMADAFSKDLDVKLGIGRPRVIEVGVSFGGTPAPETAYNDSGVARFGAALETVRVQQVDPFTVSARQTQAAITDWEAGVVGLNAKLAALAIPAPFRPGSPSPFEIALRGIADALGAPMERAFLQFGRAAQPALDGAGFSLDRVSTSMRDIYTTAIPQLQTSILVLSLTSTKEFEKMAASMVAVAQATMQAATGIVDFGVNIGNTAAVVDARAVEMTDDLGTVAGAVDGVSAALAVASTKFDILLGKRLSTLTDALGKMVELIKPGAGTPTDTLLDAIIEKLDEIIEKAQRASSLLDDMNPYMASEALARQAAASVYAQSPVVAAPVASVAPAITVSIGPNNITNGMDMAAFEQRVLNTVQYALRVGM